jgi:sugar lactone lactonase YvrE
MLQHALAHDELDTSDAIDVGGDPNGLAYDPVRGALYVADGATAQILAVRGRVPRRVAQIDPGAQIGGNLLGGVATSPSGTIFVARHGRGVAGEVFRIDPGAAPRGIGLAPEVWRLGVAYAHDEDALYTTQFRKTAAGPEGGAILRVDLATGAETTVLDGLGKPVGVVVRRGMLIVTDARDRAVIIAELGGARTRVRWFLDGGARPDSCCACGDDGVLVSTRDDAGRGAIVHLDLSGRSRTVASGPWEPRGVATDGRLVYIAARRTGRVLVHPLWRDPRGRGRRATSSIGS